MTDPRAKYWSDILGAIAFVEQFVDGIGSLNAYVADHKTKSAVERQLAIIGEAMNNRMKLDTGLRVESAGAIVGMRNRLVHFYGNVDDAVVWRVVRLHLPELRSVALAHVPPR